MLIRHFFCVFCLSLIFVPIGGQVFAQRPDYAAVVVPYEVRLRAGETKQINLRFKNVGTHTWISGKTGTALYLFGDLSIFHHPSWLRDDLPVYIAQKVVKSNASASATFLVTAPAQAGTYTERFLLSYKPNGWIKGSVVNVTFKVESARPVSAIKVRPVKSSQLRKDTTVTISSTLIATRPPATSTSPESQPASHQPSASTDLRSEIIDRGGLEWQLEPGQHTSVNLAFKNTGPVAWSNTGTGAVMLGSVSKIRKSPFKDFSWKNDIHAATLNERAVSPGQVGHVVLELRAPAAPGNYRETFQLVVSSTVAVTGSEITLPIHVTTPREYMAKGIVNGVELTQVESNQPESGRYKAALLLSSEAAKQVVLLGNGRISLTFGFKNVGTGSWNSLVLKFSSLLPTLGGRLSSLRDESWLSEVDAAKSSGITPPGHIGFIGFTFKAPLKRGTYTARFQLYADGALIEAGQLEIPITVTADGFIEPESISAQSSTTTFTPSPLNGDGAALPAEPNIRVGLFATTDDRITVRAVAGGFTVQQNNVVICRFEAGESATIVYDRAGSIYTAAGPRCASQTTGVYVAAAVDGLSPLEIVGYSHPVAWLPGANDNSFRGTLELRYAKSTESVWVINELPIEWYLKGIAETSNSSPQEYQRALLTAARTYAMYHVQRGTKHADEYYTVDAKYDQVYRGYGAEARTPNVVAAVEATRGHIVTYNGKLALTPYYSRSDGRTRAWTEVWNGGTKAWLVSVPVPWDNGKTLWGHGVGMSATGALGAARAGQTYAQILKHFYLGTELRRAYQ